MTYDDEHREALAGLTNSGPTYGITDGQRLTGLFTAEGQLLKDCCPLFQDMTPAEYQQVLLLLTREDYPPNEVILREGRSIRILWIIARGHCEVLKSAANEETHKLAEMGVGGVFGEMSFFRPGPHSASIRTMDQVSVFRLSREHYDSLVATGSSAAYRIVVNLNRILAERLASMDEWVCKMTESRDRTPQREEWEQFRMRLYSDWQF